MMIAGSSPRSSNTDWMSVWRAPGGGEPEQEIEVSELTEQLFARATLDVAVEQAEVADKEDAADGGDDGEKTAGCPRLGTRQAWRRLYWLRLTPLCERASKIFLNKLDTCADFSPQCPKVNEHQKCNILIPGFENIGEMGNSGKFPVIQTSYCPPRRHRGLTLERIFRESRKSKCKCKIGIKSQVYKF